ncbi:MULTISPECIES: hypothetical protein [Halomonas]|nr:hypothetical protein [Halomonas citrativorans]
MMKWNQWTILVLIGWLPLSVQSDTIEGMLDGEPREWFVLSQGRDSNASFVEVGDQRQIIITGFVEPDQRDAYEGLSISLTVEDNQLIDAHVVQLIGSTTVPPLYTSEGGSVTVTLTQLEQQGSHIHIAGRVEGVLALQTAQDDAPSRAEGIDIDVQFDVNAYRAQF